MSALANHIDVTGDKMEEGQIFKVKVIFVLNMLRLGCMKKKNRDTWCSAPYVNP